MLQAQSRHRPGQWESGRRGFLSGMIPPATGSSASPPPPCLGTAARHKTGFSECTVNTKIDCDTARAWGEGGVMGREWKGVG